MCVRHKGRMRATVAEVARCPAGKCADTATYARSCGRHLGRPGRIFYWKTAVRVGRILAGSRSGAVFAARGAVKRHLISVVSGSRRQFQGRKDGVPIEWLRFDQFCNSLILRTLCSFSLSLALLVISGCAPSSPSAETEFPDAEIHRGGTLIGSVRSEPRTFNRLVARDSTSSLVSELTQAALVRVDRVTDRVEPWIAESWTTLEDGLAIEFRLRQGVRFSDGSPLTAGDVLFTFEALFDERLNSALADSLRIRGQPLVAEAPDSSTVVVRFPEPFSPGVRLLGSLPILPRHRLAPALAELSVADVWGVTTDPEEMVGLGPFVLTGYQPGQRLVFARNPHYWRTDGRGESLPYLDQLVIEIVPDRDSEVLRLQSGEIDFTQSEVRGSDYATLRRAEAQGQLTLFELGVALDADFLFFNLQPGAMAADPRQSWLQADEFRRAVSQAVDRRSFADTVYLGLGEPVYGPVTPANHRWHEPNVDRYTFNLQRARARLGGLGLTDRDGDGALEDADGQPVRFTLLTQQGNSVRERAAAVLAQDLAHVGIAVDVVHLEFGALVERITAMDFDAAYIGFQASDTDPAVNLDLWLSSASFHFWNPSQPEPATEWEQRIDELMYRQISTQDHDARKQLFGQVQQVFAEFVPALYFAAPRVYVATSSRVANARPALLDPLVLWSADTLAVRTHLD